MKTSAGSGSATASSPCCISSRSAPAWGYAAYVWLLHEVSPSALGTYAYVNPAVAVVLGNLVLGETLSGLKWLGMVVILLGVILVSLPRRPARS